MLDHHSKNPYEVDNIFEAAKWILKGTDMFTGLAKTVALISGLITNLIVTATARTLV